MSGLLGKIRMLAWVGLIGSVSLTTAFSQVTSAPPPIPELKSPVDQFRKMLAMTASEREQTLAARPPELKKRLLEKLEEYDRMSPMARESQLRLTDLRWYMLSLIEVPITNRNSMLALIPDAKRSILSERLAQWDQLSLETRSEILKYEKTMEHFRGQNLEGVAATNSLIARVPLAAQPEALKNLDSFLQLPASRRQEMYASFQRFFELSGDDQQRTLALLPPQNRLNNQALALLSGLPQEQRVECLKALAKFSALSLQERQEFRKNAERWNNLSPVEQEAWRTLVVHIQAAPPLPPGLAFPPLPPLPIVQANAVK